MTISSGSPYPQRAAAVAIIGNTDLPHFSDSTLSTTNRHPESESDSDITLKEKVNSLTKRLTNGHTDHIKCATMTNPKPLLDSSGSSTDVNTVDTTVDFVGDVNTTNEIPDRELLRSVGDIRLFDQDCNIVPFKNIHSGPNVARRVLIIFVRHFFCGNCQEYIRTLAASITPDELLHLPVPSFIAIIGHGEPNLIPMYAATTGCPFPIYADCNKSLYSALGMLRTLNLGTRPEYQRRGTLKGMWESVRQGVSNLNGGRTLLGLDWYQVGGEFLIEPVNMNTPIASPADEVSKQLGGVNGNAGGYVEQKQFTWVHRMKNTRDHAELPELREVLGLDGVGIPGKNSKRWTKALGERKGTGLSARTSPTLTENGGGKARQSVTVEREKAAAALNGTKPAE